MNAPIARPAAAAAEYGACYGCAPPCPTSAGCENSDRRAWVFFRETPRENGLPGVCPCAAMRCLSAIPPPSPPVQKAATPPLPPASARRGQISKASPADYATAPLESLRQGPPIRARPATPPGQASRPCAAYAAVPLPAALTSPRVPRIYPQKVPPAPELLTRARAVPKRAPAPLHGRTRALPQLPSALPTPTNNALESLFALRGRRGKRVRAAAPIRAAPLSRCATRRSAPSRQSPAFQRPDAPASANSNLSLHCSRVNQQRAAKTPTSAAFLLSGY